jgi:cobalt transporter subunit CbtA
MALFQRLFIAVLLAGLISGAAMAALHQWRVVPLILEAETHENAAPKEAAAAHTHEAGAAEHDHSDDEWMPADGFERSAFTVAADIFAALGFAFVLGAVSVLSGFEVTARNGVIWGLAGFAVFQLAPAFGLPPELPGMPAADVVARQIWWWGTAAATATAIYGMAKFQNIAAVAVGIVLLLAPHIIGAPQLAVAEESGVPTELAAHFAAAALTIGLAFWLMLGSAYGYAAEWLGRRASASVAVTA